MDKVESVQISVKGRQATSLPTICVDRDINVLTNEAVQEFTGRYDRRKSVEDIVREWLRMVYLENITWDGGMVPDKMPHQVWALAPYFINTGFDGAH